VKKQKSFDSYCPKKGDIVWLDFDPQAGHEQAGRRPALIISGLRYNQVTGLALVCPITSKVKGYPFEVALISKKLKGVILSNHLKSLDWKVRSAEFIESCSKPVIDDVVAKIQAILAD
jgi:mRNA interferase MazF